MVPPYFYKMLFITESLSEMRGLNVRSNCASFFRQRLAGIICSTVFQSFIARRVLAIRFGW